MAKKYSDEIRNKCINLRLEGRTVKSINDEFGLSVGTLKSWMKKYEESLTSTEIVSNAEHLRVLNEVAELRKENDFLKKAASYFASQKEK